MSRVDPIFAAPIVAPLKLGVKRSSKTPVRSNIFQRLVAEIHHDLGRGWRVAGAVVAGYPLLISIEVRDRARPADITWLESMDSQIKTFEEV